MNHTIRSLLIAGPVLALMLASASDAHACHGSDGSARVTVCFTTLHAAASTAVFAPVDIHYAANDSWLPPTWSWPQIALGGVATIAGASTAIGLAADDAPEPAVDIGWSAGLMALGGFYVTHGLLSVVNYEAPVAEPADAPPEHEPPLPSVGVVPVRGGAVALLSF